MDLNSVTNDLNLFSLNELKALKASVENAMKLKRNSVKCEDFLELHSDFVQNNSIEYETLMSELETLMAKQTAVKNCHQVAYLYWRGICMVLLKWPHHDKGADRYCKLSWDFKTHGWYQF